MTLFKACPEGNQRVIVHGLSEWVSLEKKRRLLQDLPIHPARIKQNTHERKNI